MGLYFEGGSWVRKDSELGAHTSVIGKELHDFLGTKTL